MTKRIRFNRFVVAGIIWLALVAAAVLQSAQAAVAQEDRVGSDGRTWLQAQTPAPPSGKPGETPEPDPPIERGGLKGQVSGGPRPHVKTSGAAGTPSTFELPGRLSLAEAVAIQSPNDWSADFTDGFEGGIGPSWVLVDQSNDGFERLWGADSFYVHSGARSVWVAAGGADGLDPQLYYYPDNLDSWMVTNGYFDLSAVQMADVEFYMFMDTEPRYDWVFVGASVDGQRFSGEYWTGNSGGWQYFDLDLSEFVGYSEVYLAWYFHSDESNDGDYEGVWLDDITVWTYEDTGPPQGAESIQNGDFETGDLSGWTVPSGSTVEVIAATNPVAGDYVAFFGGIPNADESLFQSFTLPGGDVTSARFGFWINQFSQETASGADLFCAGLYNSDLSALLLNLGCLDGVDAVASQFDPSAWWQVDYTLSGAEWNAVKGQTVHAAFEMVTDGSLNTTVLIDDVAFQVVTGGSAGDANEPNDSTADATAATLGTPMTGLTIDPDNDYDFFAFAGNAGDTVVVDVDAAVNGSALDSFVWLLDAAGNIVCENDDDEFSTDSYLTCALTGSGAHYVVVSSYDRRGDRSYVYTLLINRSASGDPTPTPPPIPPPTPPPTPPPGGARKWTALLYIDGDNNLCRYYPNLITRMENELGAKLGNGGFLNVAVLFDRDPRFCSTGETTRYLVQPNGSYTDNVNRWDMGELNMGDPQTLINFANWAMQNYPAEHYYLAIDNHGGGITGISWDDTNQHDNLSNAELHAALKEITQNGSRKLDVFAYEACLMSMYENAYDIRQFTDYIFGFSTVSWTNAASYPSYLGDARFTATTTGRELGDIIFDVYFAAVTNPYAVSLIDAGKMEAVRIAVDNWSSALRGQVGSSKPAMTTARSNAQKIDTNGDDALSVADAYIDLWDLADKMAAQGIAATQATALKNAIRQAVVRADYRPGGANLNYANTHGLSIYWPQTEGGAYAAYVGGQIYNSTRDGTWDEFLQSYFAGKGRGGMPIDPGPVERRPATSSDRTVFLPILMR